VLIVWVLQCLGVAVFMLAIARKRAMEKERPREGAKKTHSHHTRG
jgi:hypothetical protein